MKGKDKGDRSKVRHATKNENKCKAQITGDCGK